MQASILVSKAQFLPENMLKDKLQPVDAATTTVEFHFINVFPINSTTFIMKTTY